MKAIPPKKLAKIRRDYRDANGKKLPGVTTVMGATLGWKCDPLMWWSAKLGAEAGAREALRLGFLEMPTTLDGCKSIIERATDLGRKAHVKVRDKAANLGSIAHALVESVITGEAFDDEEGWGEILIDQARPNAERIVRYVEGCGLRPEIIEKAYAGPGFGGTVDLICVDKDGLYELVDLKSGKSVREEVCIQLGAYAGLAQLHGVEIVRSQVIHAHPGEDLKIIKIPKTQTDIGGVCFAALFAIYSARKSLKLEDEAC